MTINPNWIEIQTGLYLEQNSFTVSGVTHYNSILHSGNGYCFYDTDAEVCNEDGKVIPSDEVQPSQRLYARYCITPITDISELNEMFISVPVDPSYEIVSVEEAEKGNEFDGEENIVDAKFENIESENDTLV